jgi:hypothetical protein
MEAKDIHIQEMLPIWAAFTVCGYFNIKYVKQNIVPRTAYTC